MEEERRRRDRVRRLIPQVLRRFPGRSKDYYWQTNGIHPDDWEEPDTEKIRG